MNIENNFPEHLVPYLPRVCLKDGVRPGGWDPKNLVVPAFDPYKKSPKSIKEAFHFKKDRVLMEIKEEAKKYFKPRLTGPEHKAQGIYCCYQSIPSRYLKIVSEKTFDA